MTSFEKLAEDEIISADRNKDDELIAVSTVCSKADSVRVTI